MAKGYEEMKIESLQQLAAEMSLHKHGDTSSQKMRVRAVQKQRGGEPCYLTDKRYNCNDDCEWSTGCKKLKAVWLR